MAEFKRINVSPSRVLKVVKERVFSLAIHPSLDSVLVAAGDKWGNLGFWDVVCIVSFSFLLSFSSCFIPSVIFFFPSVFFFPYLSPFYNSFLHFSFFLVIFTFLFSSFPFLSFFFLSFIVCSIVPIDVQLGSEATVLSHNLMSREIQLLIIKFLSLLFILLNYLVLF